MLKENGSQIDYQLGEKIYKILLEIWAKEQGCILDRVSFKKKDDTADAHKDKTA